MTLNLHGKLFSSCKICTVFLLFNFFGYVFFLSYFFVCTFYTFRWVFYVTITKVEIIKSKNYTEQFSTLTYITTFFVLNHMHLQNRNVTNGKKNYASPVKCFILLFILSVATVQSYNIAVNISVIRKHRLIIRAVAVYSKIKRVRQFRPKMFY